MCLHQLQAQKGGAGEGCRHIGSQTLIIFAGSTSMVWARVLETGGRKANVAREF